MGIYSKHYIIINNYNTKNHILIDAQDIITFIKKIDSDLFRDRENIDRYFGIIDKKLIIIADLKNVPFDASLDLADEICQKFSCDINIIRAEEHREGFDHKYYCARG